MNECQLNAKVSDQCERNSVRSFGHNERMNENKIAKQTYKGNTMEQRRSRNHGLIEFMKSPKRSESLKKLME